jgi:GNAT superfamily N-acetyltransferase
MPWWSGTHPDARGREAATLLLGSVVEWAAGAGRARVNLGGSAGLPALAAFKRALGAPHRGPSGALARRAPRGARRTLRLRLRRPRCGAGRPRGAAA